MPSSNEKTVKETVATGGDRILTKDEQKAAWKKMRADLGLPESRPSSSDSSGGAGKYLATYGQRPGGYAL